MPSYAEIVEVFARDGAALIREDITKRYADSSLWNGVRPLEPGFIPPDRDAKVMVISWYPNDGDLHGKGDYDSLRDNYARWGRDGMVASYRVAYRDWLASLEHIPFYKKHTLPVLSGLGLSPEQISWIPLIKLPMRPKANPPDSLIERDRDDTTLPQVHLLDPDVVWIQGITTTENWVGKQVREQITTKIVVQNLNERKTRPEREAEIARVVRKLAPWVFR